MPPTIHFVRHAQGYHNISVTNQSILDPLLTPYGKQQCEHLSTTFPYTSSIDLVVASPLKRTIYTALLSFGDLIKRKDMTIICVPELQETGDIPCDTGSVKEEIEREFQGVKVDLSRVEPGWNSKTGKWAASRDAIDERCRVARRWLRNRKEEHIVVVTHGGVLHYLTEDWVDKARFNGTGWANTEYRSYTFDPKSGNSASLIETDESRTRRRGHEKPLTEAEQRNIKRTEDAQQTKEKDQQRLSGSQREPKILAKV